MNMPCVCSLTFDDGIANQFQYAKPVLDKFNIKASFYIITKNLFLNDPFYMRTSDIVQLYKEGHEIGGHTVTHPNLYFSFPWKGSEIRKCKLDLENFGISTDTFAYPYGEQHGLVRRLVKKAGFKTARIAGSAFTQQTQDPYKIEAISITSNTSASDVHVWIKKAMKHEYLPVLVFHDVQPSPKTYGCTPGFLQNICDYLVGNNTKILPLSRAWEMRSGNGASRAYR